MTPEQRARFYYELAESVDEVQNKVTTIRCHGRLVSESVPEIRNLVKPLIEKGGRIVIDLTDLSQMDSSGLGALVGLKASAINAGYCRLELINASGHVAELLRITKLMQIFAS